MHVCRALCASTTDWTTPWAADLVQATKGRGQSATQTQLKQIQEAIAELEAAGGEPNPVSSPLICSSWELLYTSKSKFDIHQVYMGGAHQVYIRCTSGVHHVYIRCT